MRTAICGGCVLSSERVDWRSAGRLRSLRRILVRRPSRDSWSSGLANGI